jgi:hypothetical protein
MLFVHLKEAEIKLIGGTKQGQDNGRNEVAGQR